MTVQRMTSFRENRRVTQTFFMSEMQRKENTIDDKYIPIFPAEKNTEVKREKSRLITVG